MKYLLILILLFVVVRCNTNGEYRNKMIYVNDSTYENEIDKNAFGDDSISFDLDSSYGGFAGVHDLDDCEDEIDTAGMTPLLINIPAKVICLDTSSIANIKK